MIKKLDKLILKAFVGPFIATFFITLFVLVLQFFWLYIDDFVGKGLDLVTIGEAILYVAATVVPLALPLAVLLSSIMTFGNLGETFELVAIKSAGIPLLRFMRPIMLVALVLSGVAFMFNNYLLPVSNLKLNRLKYDIINKKPAFDLREGAFYTNIPGYSIKVGKKEKDDSTLREIIIFEKDYNLQDNIIIANKGIMRVSDDKRFLEFKLIDGWRYTERGSRINTNTEYIRLGFKEFKKVFDLSALQFNPTNDSLFKDNYQMLSVRQLSKAIDSLGTIHSVFKKKVAGEIGPYVQFYKQMDTAYTPSSSPVKADSLGAIIPDSLHSSMNDRVLSQLSITRSSLEISKSDYENRMKSLRFHKMAWHEKFSMSIACFVLFLIGAPLGSIIRKGGIGTPLVFAVVFFVVFFLLNNFGKKFVKEAVLEPVWGIWLATFVLIPIGVFLTYKAMRDSQLFNKEFYYRTFRRLRPYYDRFIKKSGPVQPL
ncbi:LptF/LptG family permease [Flavihumibacter sp. CACIAM 22H1]|uniref:LptF/LptG family permease n=1 Tax=Flavihumibacter sp. CACIAM 22H1 TaxID=1812911 RepID=UPI0007A90363|nr:LptF/LptG family permease [Flavihumibacter sp. CACIAM 22H1]KYP14427.1 MAG: permease [Flavihumibacter sp. CACIAM 22H1]